ncbi:Glrx3 [Ecytonucleospora hepatopenaei]|uniref:Glrx3 n=1 Tax=Ecytonucleospora hepatopenaei TaxID=646526 RepID=A0A1W0E556_9MICR|nr:Glrx3 [Ecytonucleospora hepatopenaei]
MELFNDVLSKNDFVVFYENNNKYNINDNKIAYICLDNQKLKEEFTKEFAGFTLPAVFYKGKHLENLEEPVKLQQEMEEIDIEFYTKFLNDFKNKSKYAFIIKGTIEKPYCKFTKQLLQLCKENNINEITGYNIFEDDRAREVFKIINNWQTYPMIYKDGVFLGGLDKFKENL